jgi:hypothetical protein
MATPFRIYLNLEVRNDDTIITGRPPPPLSFEETRTQPFLDGDASEYFCTIARFTLQTGNSLPVFIPIIDTSQVPTPSGKVPTDLPQNNTIYKISFVGQGGTPGVDKQIIQQNVVYQPSDQTIPRPKPPTGPGGQDLSSEYYYVRSYQDFINMINKSLYYMDASLPAPAPGVERYNPPYMEWDHAACTATLYADAYYFDLNPDNPLTSTSGRSRKFEIYFDARLYQLFSTLNATYVGASYLGLTGFDYRLDVFGDLGNTLRVNLDDAYPGPIYNISLTQETSTIAVWSPVESIVFTSSSLPSTPPCPRPQRLSRRGEYSITGSGTPNLANVLTHFQIAVSPTNQYRPEISYAPQGGESSHRHVLQSEPAPGESPGLLAGQAGAAAPATPLSVVLGIREAPLQA